MTLPQVEAGMRSPPREASRTRLDVLDVIRGFAILGIFLINIPLMSPMEMDFGTAANPSGLDAVAQTFVDLYFEGTQRGILQMLFGAGMILLTTKAMSLDGPVSTADTYLRRNMWLVLFGLLHVFVVRWGYDILHIYGLAAVFLFTFRKLPASAALAVGLGLTVLMQFGTSGGGIATGPEMMAQSNADLPGVDAVRAWYGTVKGLALWSTVGEAFATMMIGVALFKWGIIQGLRSRHFYLALTLVGYSVGMALRGPELLSLSEPITGAHPSEFGRLVMTLGHIGLINLLWKLWFGAHLLSPFRAAGRTAFTLYVMQSVIGIWVLWAPWGPLTRYNFGTAGVLATAVLVLALQVLLANLWLRRFDSGPLEMLWRWLVRLGS
jgi:uncharacterized protein